MVELSDIYPAVGTEETVLYCLGDGYLDVIWDYLCTYSWDCDYLWESNDEIEDRFWG